MNLAADKLATDQAVVSAKKQLLDATLKHSQTLTTISPPIDSKKQSYKQALEKMKQLRGLGLFYPYLGSGLGNGPLVELADGSVKYDLISGVGVHFGHSHPRLVEAHLDAALEDIVMQGNLMQNRSTLELLEILTRASGFPHAFLSTSGAIANENAMKICFQKKPGATRILAFERCFAGRTWSLSQMTDNPAYRVGLPLTIDIDYVPFYNPKNKNKTLKVLEKLLARYPGQHAVMCLELIQGEGGFYPGDGLFFKELIALLKQHEIAAWADEVQSFGRTDRLFAYQHYGLENDIDLVTVGKLLHTCALLYKTHLTPKPGLLSQTYTASTSMIRSATTILQSLLEEGFLGPDGKNMAIRKRFLDHFHALEKSHGDRFTGPYGEGLMLAFTPYGGIKEEVFALLHRLFDAGVIAFACGRDPYRIRFLPPAGMLTFEQIDHVMEIVKSVL